MMEAAANAVCSPQGGASRSTRVIGVTLLTSLSQDEVACELGIERPLVDQVTALALNAKKAVSMELSLRRGRCRRSGRLVETDSS